MTETDPQQRSMQSRRQIMMRTRKTSNKVNGIMLPSGSAPTTADNNQAIDQ